MCKPNFRDTDVYKHMHETKQLALQLKPNEIKQWLLEVGYYPEAYVLPPFFTASNIKPRTDAFYEIKQKKNNKGFEYNTPIKEYVQVSYPTEGLTSRTFSMIHPEHHHDISKIIVDNFKEFIKSYKSDRIFSYTFPIPIDSSKPGCINPKRSERQIYEFIEAAEKSLLVDAADYKFVVIADIKNFYPSVYTHAISWAIHAKKTIRKSGNWHDYNKFCGNRLDKLFQYTNDRKTNGIPIGPAVSDVISEWMLNKVDYEIGKGLPGRSFGIRFKDDYRIVCDSQAEARGIINLIQASLKMFDLTLSDEKTRIDRMPDGLYRTWMLEYDHFVEAVLPPASSSKAIRFKQYQLVQRKIFEMNKQYKAKGIAEKFLGRLLDNNLNLIVDLNSESNKKLFVAGLLQLVGQKPKIIGQVLGIFEILLVDIGVRQYIESKSLTLFEEYEDNEFMQCWLYYFLRKNNLKIPSKKRNKGVLLKSLIGNKQAFFNDTNIQLITNYKDIELSINQHVALFKG